ncbi:MAG: ketopantoate reductase family protein [Sphaerochaetaceae bacterium]|nr:ketopantoate reductase family protein [Sphaerochaetaceae bacterium]
MKVRLIGAGAVGAVVGKQLAEHCDFAFIVDDERKQRYTRKPLEINGEKINLKLLTPDEADKADLLLIALKNFQLESALDMIRPFVGENTTILSLMNGIVSERILSEAFGEEKVIYGFTLVSSLHVDNIITSSEVKVRIGEKDNSRSERIISIAKLFNESGVEAVIPEDIHKALWIKFMRNVSQNSISAILGSTYGEMLDNEDYKKAAFRTTKEVVAVGKAEGVNLTEEDAYSSVYSWGCMDEEGKSSTLQDVEAAKRTENDYFCHEVSRLGKKHNIPTPFCDIVGELVDAASYTSSYRKNKKR